MLLVVGVWLSIVGIVTIKLLVWQILDADGKVIHFNGVIHVHLNIVFLPNFKGPSEGDQNHYHKYIYDHDDHAKGTLIDGDSSHGVPQIQIFTHGQDHKSRFWDTRVRQDHPINDLNIDQRVLISATQLRNHLIRVSPVGPKILTVPDGHIIINNRYLASLLALALAKIVHLKRSHIGRGIIFSVFLEVVEAPFEVPVETGGLRDWGEERGFVLLACSLNHEPI
jgi:hypothetical protein